MLERKTIRSLYPLALAEGEGLGTAYEYVTKRAVLSPWLQAAPQPRRILVAGLPEKYGLSLDFLLLGTELGSSLVVVDERAEALEALERGLEALTSSGFVGNPNVRTVHAETLWRLEEVAGAFDLCLSSEVLQRLQVEQRRAYVRRLGEFAPALALFAPNAANPEHTTRSGLGGVHLAQMRSLLGEVVAQQADAGYLDMPPFPPGITRTDAQREQATTGRFEALAMGVLDVFARGERLVPERLRSRLAHIVYGFARDVAR